MSSDQTKSGTSDQKEGKEGVGKGGDKGGTSNDKDSQAAYMKEPTDDEKKKLGIGAFTGKKD
jgi:hypothetical protein